MLTSEHLIKNFMMEISLNVLRNRPPMSRHTSFVCVHNRYLCNSTEYRETAFFEARKSVTKKCKTFAFYIGRRYGLQVTLIYLIIKCLYIAVGITQLYWIDSFLRGAEAQNWTMKGYYYNLFTSSYVLQVLRLVQKYYHITGKS